MTQSKRKTKGRPCEIDRHVGQQLRFQRSLIGMSQEKLADALGLTFQQIQKYERGLNRISAGRLYRLAQILSVPITFFYEGYDGKKAQSNRKPLTKTQAEIIQLFPVVPAEVQKSTVCILRAFAK